MFDQNALRRQFPLISQNGGNNLIYLDSAATSQKPQSVIDAGADFYAYHNANVHRSSHVLAANTTIAFEQAREELKAFVNAKSSKEIIWTKGTTDSINLLATVLAKCDVLAGQEILISALEHHANIVPWQQLAKEKGLTLKVIPVDQQGILNLSAGLALISEKTALLAIGHVSNALGNINPVQELIQGAKARNAITFVDGAQAVSHLRVDVQALDCDFYAFSGHKMFGPTGIGVLYGKQTLLEQLPPYQFGGEMINKVSFTETTFAELPFKFEAGTPNIQGVLGLAEAVRFLTALPRAEVARHEQGLYKHLTSGLTAIKGIQLWGDPDNSVATQSFTFEGINSQDLGLLLSEQNIAVRVGHHCAMPLMNELGIDGTIRASIACYNNRADIDALLQGLEQGIKQLTSSVVVAEEKPTLNSMPLAGAIKDARGWDEIYRQVMLAGKNLSRLPEHERTQQNEVKGCESQVWVKGEYCDGQLQVQADSPSKIIRGLLAVMLEALQGKSEGEVKAFDMAGYMAELGLSKHLSPSRGNGLLAVLKAVQQL